MSINTEHWSFDKPENDEADSTQLWATNLDAIDEALLTPAEKAALTNGNATALHSHDHVVDAAADVGSYRTLGTGALQAAAGDDARFTGDRAPTTHDNTKHTTGAPSALTVGGSNTTGSSENVPRADHKHALPAFGTASGTFCEGNDSRLLTTGQKTDLTDGGVTDLHSHDVSLMGAGAMVGSYAPTGDVEYRAGLIGAWSFYDLWTGTLTPAVNILFMAQGFLSITQDLPDEFWNGRLGVQLLLRNSETANSNSGSLATTGSFIEYMPVDGLNPLLNVMLGAELTAQAYSNLKLTIGLSCSSNSANDVLVKSASRVRFNVFAR